MHDAFSMPFSFKLVASWLQVDTKLQVTGKLKNIVVSRVCRIASPFFIPTWKDVGKHGLRPLSFVRSRPLHRRRLQPSARLPYLVRLIGWWWAVLRFWLAFCRFWLRLPVCPNAKKVKPMNLHECFATNNACYKAGKRITVRGIMVHSTGANNPNLRRFGVNQNGNR